MTASAMEPGVRSFHAESRTRSDRTFGRARRHSRFIRVMRGAIPAGVVVILSLILFIAWFKPFQALADLPLDPGKLVVSGTKVTMEQPRMSGFTRDNRPYELTARAAAQDLTKPGLLELTDLHGRVQMQDQDTIEISAVNGLYDTKADVLKLADDIQLSSSTGYEAWLQEATIDIKKGTIVSQNPVAVKMATGTVNAKGLEVKESGASVTFRGGVQTYLNMGSPQATRKASAQ